MKFKKLIMSVIIFSALFFLFCTCAVNQTTGLITITNLTNNDISSVIIGDTTISSYISKGSKVDFWYYTNLEGRLSFSGKSRPCLVQEDMSDETKGETTSFVFKLNYQYKIDIILNNNQNWFYFYKGKKVGSSYGSASNNDKPWD